MCENYMCQIAKAFYCLTTAHHTFTAMIITDHDHVDVGPRRDARPRLDACPRLDTGPRIDAEAARAGPRLDTGPRLDAGRDPTPRSSRGDCLARDEVASFRRSLWRPLWRWPRSNEPPSRKSRLGLTSSEDEGDFA